MKAFAGVDSDPRQELIVVELDGIVVKCLQSTMILSLSHRGSKHVRSEAVRVDRRPRGRGIGERLIRYAVERARRRMMLRRSTDHPSVPHGWSSFLRRARFPCQTPRLNAPWNSGRIYPAVNVVNGAPRLKPHKNRIFLVS